MNYLKKSIKRNVSLQRIKPPVKHFSTFCLLLLITTSAMSQRLDYDLKAKGFNLGEFFIEQHQFGDTTLYFLETRVTINLIFTRHRVLYSGITTYVNDTLQSAEVKAIENGKEDRYTSTLRNQKTYNVLLREKGEEQKYSFLNQGITRSSSRCFFSQPAEGDTSYAELYGNFGIAKMLEEKIVLITNLKSGSTTEYTYEKGIPNKRKIEYPVLDFVMYLREKKIIQGTYQSVIERFKNAKF